MKELKTFIFSKACNTMMMMTAPNSLVHQKEGAQGGVGAPNRSSIHEKGPDKGHIAGKYGYQKTINLNFAV